MGQKRIIQHRRFLFTNRSSKSLLEKFLIFKKKSKDDLIKRKSER